MKKRTKKIIALLLVVVTVFGLVGCSQGKQVENSDEQKKTGTGNYFEKTGFINLSDEQKNKKGNYQNAQERLSDMQVVAEDEALRLYLDPEFAEFAVEDKATGECWFSNPYDYATDTKAGGDTKEEIQSLLSLTYYDVKANEATMNSYSNCTSKDQYTIEKLDDGFIFHFQIGHVEEKVLAPDVVEVSKFEEKILPHVSEREARKLNSYYTKVSMSDNRLSDAAKEKHLENVPGLKKYDFYILREATDRERRVLEEIILKTEYTVDDMDDDLVLSGHEVEKTSSPLFKMSMYVQLKDGDLQVTVPASSISYDRSNYYLASFKMLKYFGAGKYTQDGYLFIPDGSGALINYNQDGTKKMLHTTTSVYGMDYALSFNYGMNSLSTQNYFPVYGNKTGEKAMFAIIEEGDSLVNIISESGNNISAYETVYPQFIYEATYTMNYTDNTKIKGLYTYHDTNSYEGDYAVRYHFMTGKDADYVGMAKSYQTYLVEKGVLTKKSKEESEAGFYLEALGAMEKTSTKMGIPYVESVPLTTFKQAQDILTTLQNTADVNLNLRYKGWMNGGLYYSVANGMKVEKSLGGKSGLVDLESYASANNIGLYPDVDFFMVCDDGMFDGYSSSKNSVRSITRENLYLVEPQAFTNFAEFQYLNYSVSPYYFEQYMKEFFLDYDKLELSGLSTGNIGSMLYAEYNKKKQVNREQAKDIIIDGLETYVSEKKLMLDGGNAYTLPYASDLVNVPMTNSAYTLEDASVPFMQLVLHGYVNYAGEAMNLTGEYEEMFLQSIEYGSCPFYTVVADNADLIKQSSMSYYYSVDWDVLQEEIETCATAWSEAYNGLQNQEMVNHKKITSEVSYTEYEDGTAFYVNYGDADVEMDNGITIPARSYLKTKAQ